MDKEIVKCARIEALEECERLCLKKTIRKAGYHGQWEGYGTFDDYMTGPECAAKIRSIRLAEKHNEWLPKEGEQYE